MGKKRKKSKAKQTLDLVSSLIVIVILILAILIVGTRLFGIYPYTVLSGSMEPTYHVGSLIYVKTVDPFTLQEGQVITFMLDEDTLATHRIVDVVPDEQDPSVVRFQTKGDANEFVDAGLVHYKNVVGTPIATIPYLGYIATFIQNPPGLYIAIAFCAFWVMMAFIPDLFDEDRKKKKKTKKAQTNEGESL